ncbi:GntR family transcriptional regulator [Propionivibrio sp.]|uniref:GntR family transcriptional regulator n=1 Tax=Propionivibrio sp. TaxID=2212460 RepID=UPI0039E2D182
MKKLEKPASLKQRIYDIVKDDIISGGYDHGHVLNERSLSDALGVSRTPIREALKLLETEGWIEYVPYKGAIVRRMSPETLKEIFEIRNALEVLSVGLAVQRMTPEAIAGLKDFLAQQRQLVEAEQPPIAQFINLDQDFHLTIARLSGNALLVELIEKLRDKARAIGTHALYAGNRRFLDTLAEHEEIILALLSG